MNKRLSSLFRAPWLAVVLCAMTALVPRGASADDGRALAAMQKDYPGLMALYGDRIASQKAHYVFVVDVSSSMRPYEAVVKSNFLQFLNAVPDGDQVSLIKMSDESHTGFVGLLKCTPLDATTRTSIREVVNGLAFNRNGSPEDGSDGYTMAKCVIDAINVVGSNDLTFVYMLTDFEYWTHKNHYEKGREDWGALADLLPETKVKGMCKYGIELTTGGKLNAQAIFKSELNRIFGPVEYQAVGSAALLANWFSHVATGVMSVKLNTLLKEDWRAVEESMQSGVSVSGGHAQYRVAGKDTPLVNGVRVSLDADNRYFVPVEAEGSFPGHAAVGRFSQPQEEKGFFPGWLQMGGGEYTARVELVSPYAEEIGRLQGVCGEVAGQDDAVGLTRTETGKLPSALVWNSTLPLAVWALIVLVLLVVIASFVYEYAFLKLNREWSIAVKSTDSEGGTMRYNSDPQKAPFTFGPADSALTVKGAPWSLRLYTKRCNPLTFRMSGYFLCLEQGTFADVETDYDDEPRTLAVGESAFLCAPGKATAVNVRIKEKGKTDYKISLD